MNFSTSRAIEKMAAENDRDGLYKFLEHNDKTVRLEAALALAEMEDGRGWRFLMDTARQAGDPESQVTAAAILGELSHPRAIPALEEALIAARGETADAIKAAIEAIGGMQAEEALRRAGYEPLVPRVTGNQIIDFGGELVRAVQPDTTQVKFLTAEQHYDIAADLREAELAERGLVEVGVALWLKPNWAAAWYLRGVLFEDLDRFFEAALNYRRALALDPMLTDAREALADLENEHVLLPEEPAQLLVETRSGKWTDRRDAVAGLGMHAQSVPAGTAAVLVELLGDEEREVRHAAIEALGGMGDRSVVERLAHQDEYSWLLRFAMIEALARLKSVEGLETMLRREMDRVQERNPIFSREKDPLLEVEYDRLMEIGVLAFERTGDLPALLELAEDNTWEEIAEEPAGEDDEEGYEEEADEELEAYVDETAQMVCMALERLAVPQLASLDAATLQRLAAVPDLTLLELTDEEEEIEPEPVMVYDMSSLREAAKAELAKR